MNLFCMGSMTSTFFKNQSLKKEKEYCFPTMIEVNFPILRPPKFLSGYTSTLLASNWNRFDCMFMMGEFPSSPSNST
ncbi:hypothetical protein BpHYR1_018416 [Brachionus plicatilis]|uniref:Uncharacterized protein n=1 Tax=Brachionus plicatilis TaxID=10195 RepID=A0A3M7QZI3_BRAPC|nr:hypothetical protein BpHYR1_018416 [Brachionus plicatilis]